MKLKTYIVDDITKISSLLVFLVSKSLNVLCFFDFVAIPDGRLYKLLSTSQLTHAAGFVEFSLKTLERAIDIFSVFNWYD